MTNIEIPEGFTRWDGGDNAGPRFIEVEVLYRSGNKKRTFCPCSLDWFCIGDPDDIIAYRVLP